MEAQRRPVEPCGDAARAEIGFGMGAGDGPAGAKQTAGSLGRSAGHRRLAGRLPRPGTRQAEKAARLVEHLAEGVEPAIESHQIEAIAMLAGGGVGTVAAVAGTGHWSRVRTSVAEGKVGAVRLNTGGPR